MNRNLTLLGYLCSGLVTTAYAQNPAGPAWWYEGDPPAVEAGLANIDNNAVANVGQGKWMALRALDSIPDVSLAARIRAKLIPSVFDDSPPAIGEEDKNFAPLQLGQLKAIAKPLYDELNLNSPDWVRAQLAEFGVTAYEVPADINPDWSYISGGVYPWEPTLTLDPINHSPANLGQLKAVFALELGGMTSDSLIFNAYEYERQRIFSGYVDDDEFYLAWKTEAGSDFDGDGLSNIFEFYSSNLNFSSGNTGSVKGLSPVDVDSDGDGFSDWLSSNALLYLKLDEASGDLANDSSFKLKHSALSASLVWLPTAGIGNGALEFQGGVEEVRIPYDALDGANDVTISFWFKTSNAVSSQTILSAVNSSQIPELAVSLEMTSVPGDTIRFDAGADQSFEWSLGRSQADGLWHHVTIVRDSNPAQAPQGPPGSEVTNGLVAAKVLSDSFLTKNSSLSLGGSQVTLYLDGKVVEQPKAASSFAALEVESLVLGQRHNGISSVDSSKAYVGLLDEVRIFSTKLEEKHVLELFSLNDLDSDGLPDDYERSEFGSLRIVVDADSDRDGDGATNREEFESGTDPFDYFNGVTPQIEVVEGSPQEVFNGARTEIPLVFLVTSDGTTPFSNAPITLQNLGLLGDIQSLEGGLSASSLDLRTDASGKVSVHFHANY